MTRRLLLDLNLPRPMAGMLDRFIVRTVAEVGWSTLVNGKLLEAPEREGFDVFLSATRTGLFNAWTLVAGESDVPQLVGEMKRLTRQGIPETANV